MGSIVNFSPDSCSSFEEGVGVSKINSQSPTPYLSSMKVSNSGLSSLMVCSKNLESSLASVLADCAFHTSKFTESVTPRFVRFTVVN